MWSSGAVVSLGPGTPGCSAEYGTREPTILQGAALFGSSTRASVGILHPPRPFTLERVHFGRKTCNVR